MYIYIFTCLDPYRAIWNAEGPLLAPCWSRRPCHVGPSSLMSASPLGASCTQVCLYIDTNVYVYTYEHMCVSKQINIYVYIDIDM